jgi:hypothetical protein
MKNDSPRKARIAAPTHPGVATHIHANAARPKTIRESRPTNNGFNLAEGLSINVVPLSVSRIFRPRRDNRTTPHAASDVNNNAAALARTMIAREVYHTVEGSVGRRKGVN